MQPYEMNDVCKQAFIELVFNHTPFHGRTWCYFHPYKGRKPCYHITVADKSTGFSVVIPLETKNAMLLEKANMKDIFAKTVSAIFSMEKKHPEMGAPVDYAKNPVKVFGKSSKYIGKESNGKVSVEIFDWGRITS